MTKYIHHISFVALCVLLALCSTSLFGQVNTMIKIPLTLTETLDNGNPGKSITLWFGWHPNGSYCLDTISSPIYFAPCDSEKQEEQPPPPQSGIFDVRFVPVKSSPRCDAENTYQGLLRIFQPSNSAAQKDTFKIVKQGDGGGDGYPWTWSWPSGLNQFCDSMQLIVSGHGRYSMLTHTSLVETDFSNGIALIYVWGLKGTQTPPDVPSLVSPSNGVTGQPASLNLTWGTVPGAILYSVSVSTDSLFRPYTFAVSDTTSNLSYTASGLAQGTKYFWKINAHNTFLEGCGNVNSFTTAITSSPTLVLPTNGQTDAPARTVFSWTRVPGVNYHLQLSTSSTFSSILLDTTVSDTTMQYNLSNCAQYYWKVQGVTVFVPSGGPYSTQFNFSVISVPPSVPALANPPDSLLNAPEQPTFSWSATNLCTQSFLFEIAKDTGFSMIVVTQTQPVSQTTFQPAPLEGQETYYWRVTGKSSTNALGAHSPVRMFTTAVFKPRSPILLFPANATIAPDTSITYTWHTPPNKPTSYVFQVDTSANFTHPYVDSISTTDTTVQFGNLLYCTHYFWRVFASNTAGTSQPSQPFSFDVQRHVPAIPVLDQPINGDTGVTDVKPLTWHGDACTNKYLLQVSLDSEFGSFIEQDTVTTPSKKIVENKASTIYYWRVYGINELGSTLSAVSHFTTAAITTPTIPVLVSPSYGSIGILRYPTLCWDSVTSAQTYRLQVSVDPNFATLVFNDSTITTLCRQVGPLLYSRTYYWRVSAKNPVGTSDYQDTTFFFTTLFPPDSIRLIDPPNGTHGVSVSPQLQWSVTDRADSYQLQVARDSTFGVWIYNDTTITTQSWQVYDLISRTQYFWRVRAKNAAGYGTWSSTFTFMTTVVGVANWVIPVAVGETGFGLDSLYFGLHPNATYGIDVRLGEFQLPPVAIGQFDTRFIDLPSRPHLLGEGLRLNLEPFQNYAQVDSFLFSFQLGTGTYPVHVSWDPSFVRQVCDSMVIEDVPGGLNTYARMDLSGSVDVTNLSTKSLFIIMYGAYPAPTGVKPDQPNVVVPTGFTLSQNYPNPFNPTTQIQFTNEKRAIISVGVFDVLGREVSRLADGETYAGVHTVTWNGRDQNGLTVPSGIYYLRMIATPFGSDATSSVLARKMLFLK